MAITTILLNIFVLQPHCMALDDCYCEKQDVNI